MIRTQTVTAVIVVTSVTVATLAYISYKPKRKQDTDNDWENDTGDSATPDNSTSAPKVAERSQLHFVDSLDLPSHIRRQIKKDRLRKDKAKHLAMKGPMYDNIRMLDPQGELLSQVSLKKATWYVTKDLASWFDDNGRKSIKLRFEPKNRSSRGEKGSFVKSDKKNACVVCGGDEYFMRHYVVPYAYRTLFPKRFKSKLSHDIVILCPNCSLIAGQERQKRMDEIEDKCRGHDAEPKFIVDTELHRVRSKALALLRWKERIPAEKIEEYDNFVRRHLNLLDKSIDLTDEQLQSAIDVEPRVENPKYIPGAVIVAAYLGNDEEKIAAFVRDWRIHFIETMHPQHLPIGWGVDSSVECGSD
mmetsp:Transcript_43873/g.133625  ORF Transcript_43873/g.133625 Transcript_43873/m.133625 type:complete len:359 (+) Transcript_43873:232-1308(+)